AEDGPEARFHVAVGEREPGLLEDLGNDALGGVQEGLGRLPADQELGPNRGTGKRGGRRSTRPSAWVTSWLVTGPGATRFTGPVTGSSRRWAMAATTSSMVIQLHHCFPEPMRPPTPSRKRGRSLASAPPPGARTMPVRIVATRIPASA